VAAIASLRLCSCVVSLRYLHSLSASRCGARASYSVWCLSCSVLRRDASCVVTAHGCCCAGVAVSVALQGLPLSETLQILYKIRRDKFLLEMSIFLVHFFVFIFIVLEVALSLRGVGCRATATATTMLPPHDDFALPLPSISPVPSFGFAFSLQAYPVAVAFGQDDGITKVRRCGARYLACTVLLAINPRRCCTHITMWFCWRRRCTAVYHPACTNRDTVLTFNA
jgi:hypothetical protein